MFYYIEGTVTIIDQGFVVVDAGGVGYHIYASLSTISQLELGARARLYTYCNIREDAFDIYGFFDLTEKRCYELLVSVSGVGPKAAMSILSSCTPADLAVSIMEGSEKTLMSAPGIGKRTAQRIILELKDKISKENIPLENSKTEAAAAKADENKKAADISAALAVLGYSSSEISAALKNVSIEKMTVEEAIRYVLKNSVK